MDGESGKKRIKKGLIYCLMVMGYMVIVGVIYHYMTGISDQQLHELLVIYPDLKEPLIANFTYYDGTRKGLFWMVSGLGLVLMGGLFVGLHWRAKKISIKAYQVEVHQLKKIIDTIEAFQKGDFHLHCESAETGIVNEPLSSEKSTLASYWQSLEEKLKALAFYMMDLKTSLAHEEDATKRLITDISHQLKTPLASLKMSYELAEESHFTQAERASFRVSEKQEILKLERLISELVKLSRLEHQMIRLQIKDVAVKKMLIEAMNSVLPKATAKKIEFQVAIEASKADFSVKVDEKWTIEALANLLDNAVKYSHEGGSIVMRLKQIPNLVILEIEDQGIGILPEESHLIFKRFYRGKLASSFEKEGAGVGLYLARQIIEEEGGTITAKRLAQGTCFRITFPLQNC